MSPVDASTVRRAAVADPKRRRAFRPFNPALIPSLWWTGTVKGWRRAARENAEKFVVGKVVTELNRSGAGKLAQRHSKPRGRLADGPATRRGQSQIFNYSREVERHGRPRTDSSAIASRSARMVRCITQAGACLMGGGGMKTIPPTKPLSLYKLK